MYPKFFTAQVSYEVRDCFFPIKRYNSDMRMVPEDKHNEQIIVTWNGLQIGECDEILIQP